MTHPQTSPSQPFTYVLLAALTSACLFGGVGCSSPPVPVRNENLKANPVRYLRYTLRGEPQGYHVNVYRSNCLE